MLDHRLQRWPSIEQMFRVSFDTYLKAGYKLLVIESFL